MKRLTIFFITIALLTTILLSCPPQPAENTDTPPSTTSTTATSTTTTTIPASFIESLVEKYIEKYDGDTELNIVSWNYLADGTLSEYSVYYYDENGRDTQVLSYGSETTSDATYLGKYKYTYVTDNTNDARFWSISKGEVIDKNNVVTQYYDATYNENGNYLTFVLKDTAEEILESRTSTYDASGHYYLKETYYNSSEQIETNKFEEYSCEYDPAIPGRYVKEIKYHKISAAPTDPSTDAMAYPDYVTTITYTFSWNASGKMYLQQSFDASGDLCDIIQYQFNSYGNKKMRSFYSGGKLQSYRTYFYDDEKNLINESRYAISLGDKLENKFLYRYYGTGPEYYYEESSYTYSYPASRNLNNSTSIKKNFITPKVNRRYNP